MSILLERLRRDHEALRQALAALEAEIAAMEPGRAPSAEPLRGLTDQLRATSATHHPCEHSVLAFLHVRAPEAAARMASLAEDHQRLERARQAVAAALDAVPVDGARLAAAIHGLVADHRAHMRREEADFFPAAERYLTRADWRLAEAFCARWIGPPPAPRLNGSRLA